MCALPLATPWITLLGCSLRVAPGKGLSSFCPVPGTL